MSASRQRTRLATGEVVGEETQSKDAEVYQRRGNDWVLRRVVSDETFGWPPRTRSARRWPSRDRLTPGAGHRLPSPRAGGTHSLEVRAPACGVSTIAPRGGALGPNVLCFPAILRGWIC